MKKFLLALSAIGFVFASQAQSSMTDALPTSKEVTTSELVNAKSAGQAKEQAINVHPVPAQGSTNVDCAAGILSVTVRRADGQVIQRIPAHGVQHMVVSFQRRGIHVLEVLDRNGIRHVVRVLVETV